MELDQLVSDVGDALLAVDASPEPFKNYQLGVGPYGEPQLVKRIAQYLNTLPAYESSVETRRTPDLLITGQWAIEFKITRPFGDNGKEAEDWSVNLLHPYPGNVSAIGDALKLCGLECPERKAIVVIGYEHDPCQIDLDPLVRSFELISREVAGVGLGERVEARQAGLVHPVHQVVRVFAWEVL